MRVAADISLYPLNEEFIPPIDDVIARLKAHASLQVETNAMSTQIVGEYEDVLRALNQELKQTFGSNPKAVFVIKMLNNPLKL